LLLALLRLPTGVAFAGHLQGGFKDRDFPIRLYCR